MEVNEEKVWLSFTRESEKYPSKEKYTETRHIRASEIAWWNETEEELFVGTKDKMWFDCPNTDEAKEQLMLLMRSRYSVIE